MTTVQVGVHYDPKFTLATDTPPNQTKVAEVEREEDSPNTQITNNNIRGSQPFLRYRIQDIQKIKDIEKFRLMEQITTERIDKE
jgi:phenylacetate-coenzyme A ligase PaaK-like adenylate-forming protein